MTKKEAWKDFRENYLPEIERRESIRGHRDRPMRAEAWNNYTDALQRDGQITERQCASWTHPKELGS